MADEASHSLLLNRGLVRVFLPWPPRTRDGARVEPEFTIEVVRDPTGCNLDPVHGLASATPTISVYRRPRPVANLKYVTAAAFGVGPFNAKDAQPAARDPDTGKLVNMNMMADAREPTLKTQALGSDRALISKAARRAPRVLERLLDFETQIYAAQSYDVRAGELAEPNGPPALGPRAMADGRTSVLGNNVTNYVFPIGDAWREIPRSGDAAGDARSAARESIARGHDVFFYRTFWIKDAMHLNTVGLGNPVKRTCATCHGMHMTGMDTANGWMDIGTTNLPWATRDAAEPVGEAGARDAAVQAHVRQVGRAAPVSRPRDLHAGPGPRADHGPLQRHRHDRDAAVPRARRARAVFLERLGARSCASSSTSTIGASTFSTASKRSRTWSTS